MLPKICKVHFSYFLIQKKNKNIFLMNLELTYTKRLFGRIVCEEIFVFFFKNFLKYMCKKKCVKKCIILFKM